MAIVFPGNTKEVKESLASAFPKCRKWPRIENTWHVQTAIEDEFFVLVEPDDDEQYCRITFYKGEEASPEQVAARWPRICAHLICESLGYLTPRAAAIMLRDVKQGKPFYCEWTVHLAGSCQEEAVQRVTQRILQAAIKRRRRHEGYMADFNHALSLVKEMYQTGSEPMLASWF